MPRTATPGLPGLLRTGPSRRVCLVLLSGVGDVVHGLALAHDLKRDDPTRKVVWVAEPAPSRILLHHPAVDEVIVYRVGEGLRGIRGLWSAFRGRRCDVTVNAQRYLKSAWPTLFSRSPVRVGLAPSRTRDGIRFAHTHVLPEGPWKHTQDLLLDFRGPLGLPEDGPVDCTLHFSGTERAEQESFFRELDQRPIVSLVLASANPKKDWMAERYARLADALHREYGFRVILVGGSGRRERRIADAVLRLSTTPPLDCLGDSVRRLMWLVDGSDLVVAPDTGPLHIAHAVEVPVIGLYGHTNPWRVGPYRLYHDLVVDHYTDPGEEPDPSHYLPRDDRMRTITVEEVLEKVDVARARYL